MSTKDQNLPPPLLCLDMSAGLGWMEARFNVGGTIDTLAAGEASIVSVPCWGMVGVACGWILCLGPLARSALLVLVGVEVVGRADVVGDCAGLL